MKDNSDGKTRETTWADTGRHKRNERIIEIERGVHNSAVGWGTELQAGKSWLRFPLGSFGVFIDLIFRPHYGPGVDSAFNRNEYYG